MTDPLGLTTNQRERSDLGDAFQAMMDNITRNRQMIEDLPAGTRVQLSGFGGPYPEMTREHLLDVML